MLIFTMDFKLWHSAGPKGRSIPDSEGLMLIHDCKTLPFSYSTTNELERSDSALAAELKKPCSG
jgi:hypothetical protein